MSDNRPINIGSGPRIGGRRVLHTGTGPEQQTNRRQPVTVYSGTGCARDTGAMVQSVSCGIDWTNVNLPAGGGALDPGLRSYVCGRVQWTGGDGESSVEFDWKQGVQLAVPGSGLIRVAAWIQEFLPDPGIQDLGGTIAAQRTLDPLNSYEGLIVSASVGEARSVANYSILTKTYPLQQRVANESIVWRLPAYAHEVNFFSPSTIAAGDVAIRFQAHPTVGDGQNLAVYDLATLQTALHPFSVPGGTTHIIATLGAGAGTIQLIPTFSLSL